MSDLAPLLLGPVTGFVVVVALLIVDAYWARRTFWESLAIWWRSYLTFSRNLAAVFAPPTKHRPPARPSELERARSAFIAGRIDVEEYERRVEAALPGEDAA